MEKVLNQQEIDEMVRAARAGNASAGATGPVVQPWDIRQAGQIGSDQLRAISQLHEAFARNLATAIGGYLRIAFGVSLVSAEHLTFREFLQRIPEQTYLASCDLAPAGAIAVPPARSGHRLSPYRHLAGREGTHSAAARDLTEIEEQVLEGIVRIMLRELQNSWNAIALEFNFGARQPILQTQRLMPPEEKNLGLSFEIKMAETRGTLNLAVPAVVSNALLRKMSADFSHQRRRSPAEARGQIQKRLLQCFFPVGTLHARPASALEKLSNLAPGQLLPFSRNASEPAALAVEDVPLGSASPVRVNACRAARVLSLKTSASTAGAP